MDYYIPGGTMAPDAPSYVARDADNQLYHTLLEGTFAYILTPRQQGKSSLMIQTIQRLRQQGVAVAALDLSAIGFNLEPDRWYRGLLSQLGRRLGLEDEIDAFVQQQSHRSPLQLWQATLRDLVLERLAGNVVIFLDEIDIVRSLPFSTDELFAAIRACYNARAEDNAYQRLTFCLLGVATPNQLIRNPRLTPFNIGKRIDLADFTAEETGQLRFGLGKGEATNARLMARIHHWTGGHPNLTQRLCLAVAQEEAALTEAAVDRLCARIFFAQQAELRDDNLSYVQQRLLAAPEEVSSAEGREAHRASLLNLYQQLLQGKRVADNETDELVQTLKLSGAVRAEGGYLVARNRIYARVFDRRWVQEHLPGGELRRQRAAFARGVGLASAISVLVLAVMVGLALWALSSARRADRNARRADEQARNLSHQVYVGDMNLIQSAYEQNNFARVNDLLEQTRTSPYRGWEWGYWQRLAHLDLLTLQGHRAGISSVCFSPDGTRVLTGSYDDTAKLWDAATGHELLTLKHDSVVASACFSPDGRRILTGSYDKTAKVWDAVTGQELLTLKGHKFGINSVRFSRDGKRILTGSVDRTAKVWDAATGHELLTLKHNAVVSAVSFSPDSRLIVTGNGDRTAKVWDVTTGQIILTLRHNWPISSVCFSPDGRRILTGSPDMIARVWDTASGHKLLVLKGHSDYVNSVCFSLDGKRILTGSADHTAKVWDVVTGKELFTIKGHSGSVTSVCFSPDGRRVLTGSDDSTAKLWPAVDVQKFLTFKGHRGGIYSVSFSPDGRRILTGCSDKTAKVWDAATGQQLLTLEGHRNGVRSVCFSPDGRRILTGSQDNTARLWPAAGGKEIFTLKEHSWWIISVCFSPDGRRLLTCSQDKTAKVWDAASGHKLLTLEHGDAVISGCFSPDGRRILTGCYDNTAKVWDAATGQELFTLTGHDGPVRSVCFSPDGRRILTGSWDKTAKVWDAATGQPLLTLKGNGDRVVSVCFSPDGRRILTGSNDKSAKLWDATLGQELLTLKGHGWLVSSACFSPDGKRILTGSWDNTARIWISDTQAWAGDSSDKGVQGARDGRQNP
jgi:WD40 repeat protein